MTLEQLRTTYDLERARTDRDAPRAESIDGGPCRYCGTHWRRWAGTKLDGHAKCIVGPDFQEMVLAFGDANPQISWSHVAAALDVSTSIIRAWMHAADKARRRISITKNQTRQGGRRRTMITTEEFLKMELGLDNARKKPGYQPNPIVEDFWRLIEAYRHLLVERDADRTKHRADLTEIATEISKIHEAWKAQRASLLAMAVELEAAAETFDPSELVSTREIAQTFARQFRAILESR